MPGTDVSRLNAASSLTRAPISSSIARTTLSWPKLSQAGSPNIFVSEPMHSTLTESALATKARAVPMSTRSAPMNRSERGVDRAAIELTADGARVSRDESNLRRQAGPREILGEPDPCVRVRARAAFRGEGDHVVYHHGHRVHETGSPG